MSFSAAHESRVVSFERYRSERNRQRAQCLAQRLDGVALSLLELGDPAFLRPLQGTSPRRSGRPGSSPLTTERITHRRRMLAHLEAARAGVVRRLG
jgi:hypothetical protein